MPPVKDLVIETLPPFPRGLSDGRPAEMTGDAMILHIEQITALATRIWKLQGDKDFTLTGGHLSAVYREI